MSPSHAPDPELLRALGRPCGDNGPLRQAILQQTSCVIRRRRRLRSAALAVALLGCYLTGAATTYIWTAGPGSPQQLAAQPAPAPAPTPDVNVVQQQDTHPARQPATAKLARADRPKRSRFEILCRASDRQLYVRKDVVKAIRFGNRALDVATPEELAISPDRDSWLLIALKQERIRKENRDENSST